MENKTLYPPSTLYDIALHLERFPGGEILLTSVGLLEELLAQARANSVWGLTFGLACCAIEMIAAYMNRFDLERFGTITRATPRQADLMIVAGTVTIKMAPRLRRLYEQMPYPKWVIAMGSCAVSGDHYRNVYSVVPGVDRIVPVDVYVPGCPPSPEALIDGIKQLQEKIKAQAREIRRRK